MSLVTTAVTCVAVAAMRVWNPVTTSRRDLFKRSGMGDPVTAILEGLSPISWGIAAYLLATGSPWSVGFLALSVGLLLIGYARAKARGTLVAL